MTNQLEDDLAALFDVQTRSLGLGTPPQLDRTFNLAPPRRRPDGRLVAIAAAMLLFVGGVGLWWVVDTRGGSAPTDEPDFVLMPTEPPLFELRAPGWTISSYSEASDPSRISGSTTFVVAATGLRGPRIDVSLSGADSAPISDAEPDPIQIGGDAGDLLVNGDRVQVRWTVADGSALDAIGTNVSVDDLVAVAEAIDVVDGVPVATASLPPGFVALTGRDAELMHTFYEYQWLDNSGLQLQLSLYGGGRSVYDERVSSLSAALEERTVNFQGGEAYVARDEFMIRLDQVRGFWVVEISGYAQTLTDPVTGELSQADAEFESMEQFLQIANQLVSVDALSWRASLPADIVLPDEVPEAIEELATFPLPGGEAVTAIPDGDVTQPRSSVAQAVAAQTVCAWLQEVIDATDTDDPERAISAASVIHDVAAWNELDSIPDTIVGTDALTLTGRIRRLDIVLEPLRSFDAEKPDALLADLDIMPAIDSVFEASGVALECPAR